VKAIIADDDRAAVLILSRTLERWGVEVVVAHDGMAAREAIAADPSIGLGIIDWMMPGIEGPELCRWIRSSPAHDHMYVLLLTARDAKGDLVAGLDAGADDYLIKPFDADELRARVHVGLRVLRLQQTLTERATELQKAAANITRLQTLLPICSYCKNIRADKDYWEQLEDYLAEHTDLQFSHGICPDCYDTAVKALDEPESK
jgi:DNA-binding response OmpR family regulator